ncbi:TIGR03088 family PEP-CTERM/XrtA system glycosyltransferase [Neptunicella sp. SCSIO 80796]|uniref:TIGR03088 family PEP-CTERM/XrtA system glycosyltransferase n=1 Tax=Neptunicella plasticusilytica TaxID=3117012 RepID=UPI003A4E14C7
MPQTRLHIAHIIYRFDTGGLENGVVNLINNLSESQYSHTIITLKGHCNDFAKRLKTGNVQFFDLAKKQGNDIGIFWRLNSLLKTLKPDILHTRNTATLEMQLVGWWRKIPLRIHGEHGWDVNDMHGQNRRYQKLRKVMSHFIHQYVALSLEAKEYLLTTINIQPDKVNHICNGVDDTKFSPIADKVTSPFIVGCVGRLEEVKNHILLAEAFGKFYQLVKDQTQPVELHLIGDGSCKQKIEASLKRYQCIDKAWLAGNRNDIADLMPRFDVFVLPSLAEGISNTILEAMACGLPVIATKVGGNTELVQHDKTGYLVSPEQVDDMVDCLNKYYNYPELSHMHGDNSRRVIEQKFSIDTMTKQYDALYQSMSA